MDLFLVPLASNTNVSYTQTLCDALTLLQLELSGDMKTVQLPSLNNNGGTNSNFIKLTLVFGDLHLKDIREWRETTFGSLYDLKFPVFGKSYDELQNILFANIGQLKGVDVNCVKISAWMGKFIQEKGFDSEGGEKSREIVGKIYDVDFVANLPKDVDLMGENGEFHTHVIFN